MATRSAIGMIMDTNEVVAVYCHYDGYPEWNGSLLVNYYNDAESAHKIVSLGSISSLNARLIPLDSEKHSFNTPEPQTTIAYHRDRGEEFECSIFDNKEEFLLEAWDAMDAQYLYLYEKDGWHCYDTKDSQIDLGQFMEYIQ